MPKFSGDSLVPNLPSRNKILVIAKSYVKLDLKTFSAINFFRNCSVSEKILKKNEMIVRYFNKIDIINHVYCSGFCILFKRLLER